jgi:hypothetical protein
MPLLRYADLPRLPLACSTGDSAPKARPVRLAGVALTAMILRIGNILLGM